MRVNIVGSELRCAILIEIDGGGRGNIVGEVAIINQEIIRARCQGGLIERTEERKMRKYLIQDRTIQTLRQMMLNYGQNARAPRN